MFRVEVALSVDMLKNPAVPGPFVMIEMIV